MQTPSSGFSLLHLRINNTCAHLERMLDVAGYIPGVSTLSSVYRYRLALTQLVVAIAASALALLDYAYGKLRGQALFRRDGKFIRQMAKDNAIGAAGNFMRSLVESIPLLNMSLILFDRWKASLIEEKQWPLITRTSPAMLNVPLLHRPYLADLDQPVSAAVPPSHRWGSGHRLGDQ